MKRKVVWYPDRGFYVKILIRVGQHFLLTEDRLLLIGPYPTLDAIGRTPAWAPQS